MDGLEAVELKLSDVLIDNDSCRFDSEYFKKDLISFYKNISHFDKLSSFVEYGYRVVYENTKILNISQEENSSYTGFLQASDISTPEVNFNSMGFVDNADWENYPKGRIEVGELLIEVKGKAEKVAIVYDDAPTKVIISGSLFKLKVNDRITKEYLLIFLLCKYGVMFKDRAKTNLLISYISKPDLYNIPVPIPSKLFQDEITKLVNKAHGKLGESNQLYKEAEELLLSELGLLDFVPNDDNIAIKSFSGSFSVSGRLDSEYYQPKYDDIISHIKQTKHDKLGGIVDDKKSIEPGSEAYQEEGIPFVRVSNVSKFEITTPDIHLPYSLFSADELEALQPQKDTILLSKDGTVGIAYCIKEDANIITSGALLHLTIKSSRKVEVLPEYLTLVLNSKVVQMQAERDAGGSIIQHWKPSEIQEVLIPILDKSTQEQIEAKIKQSFALKEQSKQLLELAKRAVEVAIEESEHSAMELINNAKI